MSRWLLAPLFPLDRDGYHWAALNGGQPWLKPEHPGELMRDPLRNWRAA